MRRLAAAVLVPLSIVAACKRSEPGDTVQRATATSTTVPETTTSTTSTTAPRTPEQVVTDDYLAGWDAVLAAVESRNPDHPALVDLYREEALERTQSYIRSLVEKNRTAKGTVTHEIGSVTINGTEAALHDCADDQYPEYDAAGNMVQPAEGRVGRDNRLRLEQGRWRTFVIYLRPEVCR